MKDESTDKPRWSDMFGAAPDFELGPPTVVLQEDEVLMARTAVRKYLQKLRNNYRADTRKDGRAHFANTKLRRFDDYLDLYALLGGNIDDVRDPEGDA